MAYIKQITLPSGDVYDINAVKVNSHTVEADVPSNNVSGSGTSGNIAKFDGANSITDGPAFGSSTTTFLRNDGSWATPAGEISLTYTYDTTTCTLTLPS